MINRRTAIKQIGGRAGAAAMAKYLPGCGSSPDEPKGITTYVYMMMENRSYDHFFGARSKLEGKAGEGLKMSLVSNALNGNPIAPWAPSVDLMCEPDAPLGWVSLHNSWYAGACDGFVMSHQLDHCSSSLIDPLHY